MRVRPALVALATILVVALAGCSKGSPSTGSNGPGGAGDSALLANPCLVTTAEAAEAYGESVSDGKVTAGSGSSICVYSAAVGSVTIQASPNTENQYSLIKTTQKGIAGANYQEFTDLGEDAYTNGYDVYVLVRSTILKFSVIGAFTDRGARALKVARAADLA